MKLLSGLFQTRLRGFRVIDLAAFGCLSALVLGVYAFKAHAGGESAKISEVDSQISGEQRDIRLLHAELARLEQPERLERLSSQVLGLAPISPKHEAAPEGLMEIARQAQAPASTAPAHKAAATSSAAKPAGAAPASAHPTAAQLPPSGVAPHSTAQTDSAPPARSEPGSGSRPG